MVEFGDHQLLPFLRALCRSPEVAKGRFDTEWIEREFLAGFTALATAPAPDLAVAAVALAELLGAATRGGTPTSNGSESEATPGDAFGTAGPWRQGGLA
jgi:hypothetical protein